MDRICIKSIYVNLKKLYGNIPIYSNNYLSCSLLLVVYIYIYENIEITPKLIFLSIIDICIGPQNDSICIWEF